MAGRWDFSVTGPRPDSTHVVKIGPAFRKGPIMAESFIEAKGECARCGGAIHTLDNPPTDDSIVTCQSCGEQIGTYKDVHDKLGKVALDQAIAVRNAAIARIQQSIRRANRKLR